jgi:hypothetical protein
MKNKELYLYKTYPEGIREMDFSSGKLRLEMIPVWGFPVLKKYDLYAEFQIVDWSKINPKTELNYMEMEIEYISERLKKSIFFEKEIITEIAGDEPAITVSGEFFCNQLRHLEDGLGLVAVSSDKEIILEFTHETRRKLFGNFVF